MSGLLGKIRDWHRLRKRSKQAAMENSGEICDISDSVHPAKPIKRRVSRSIPKRRQEREDAR